MYDDSYSENAVQRRLECEALTHCLGTLGSGVNVAKVQVSWYFEDPGLGFETGIEEHAGFYFACASGEEPEAQGEEGTIYAVFENLVNAAMDRRQEKLGFASYAIDDISAA